MQKKKKQRKHKDGSKRLVLKTLHQVGIAHRVERSSE